MATDVVITPATPADVARFAREFTAIEGADARANGVDTAEQAFMLLIDGSVEAWTAARAGRIGFMVGARRRLVDGDAQLWFHAVRYFTEHSLVFVRAARRLLDEMLTRYAAVHAIVEPADGAMVRFVEWLGFDISAAPVPLGPRGVLFHRAVRQGS